MMTESRKLLFWIALVASAALEACSGKFTSDSQGQAGAASTAGGARGASTGASASAGESGSSAGAPCCLSVWTCDPTDETLNGSTKCPLGASCYSLEGCCGAVTYCAHFYAPPVVDAGPFSDAGACTLLGAWSTDSAPWNGESTDAVITFNGDGTLTGEPSFTGSWFLTGSTLTIQNTVGPDMTCPFADHWTLTFSGDCLTAPLVPIDSGCTGARRYLDWNVTLKRVLVK